MLLAGCEVSSIPRNACCGAARPAKSVDNNAARQNDLTLPPSEVLKKVSAERPDLPPSAVVC